MNFSSSLFGVDQSIGESQEDKSLLTRIIRNRSTANYSGDSSDSYKKSYTWDANCAMILQCDDFDFEDESDHEIRFG